LYLNNSIVQPAVKIAPVDRSQDPAQAIDMPPALPDFAAAADALRRQELARLADAVTPPLEALRSLTPAPFRFEIALMVERLGHTVVTEPGAPNLVTVKDGRKFIIACATPADSEPAGTGDLARLHDAVIAASAQSGIYVTTRSFTADARAYAASMPILQLVDGKKLVESLKRSKHGAVLPATYKAMCRHAGRSFCTSSRSRRPSPAPMAIWSRPRLPGRRSFRRGSQGPLTGGGKFAPSPAGRSARTTTAGVRERSKGRSNGRGRAERSAGLCGGATLC
jgi:hypothetical protein